MEFSMQQNSLNLVQKLDVGSKNDVASPHPHFLHSDLQPAQANLKLKFKSRRINNMEFSVQQNSLNLLQKLIPILY